MSYATRKMDRIARYRTRSYAAITVGMTAARLGRTFSLLSMLINLALARHLYAIESALDAHESALNESTSRYHDEIAPSAYINDNECILSRSDVADIVALIPTIEGFRDSFLDAGDAFFDYFVRIVYRHIEEGLQAGTWPVLKGSKPVLKEWRDGTIIVLER